jgi:hypothetical protein
MPSGFDPMGGERLSEKTRSAKMLPLNRSTE